MTNTFRVDNVEQPPSAKELAKALLLKAEEYLSGLMLDTGLRVDAKELLTLQVALLEDFIEVHNAALNHRVHLPTKKGEVDELIA